MTDKLCECGCGLPVTKPKNRFISGHNKGMLGKKRSEEFKKKESEDRKNHPVSLETRVKISESLKKKNKDKVIILPLCQCGCGKLVNKPKNKYLIGHQNRNRVVSEEERKKLSDSIKRLNRRGKNSHMWGKCGELSPNWKKKRTPDQIKNISNGHIGILPSEETKKAMSIAHKGKPKSEEWIRKISEGNKGKKVSDRCKKKLHDANVGKKQSKATLEKRKESMTHEVRKQMSESKIKNWQDPKYVAKQMKSHQVKKNKKEIKLESLLNIVFPNEWEFVGDGKLIINGKCPDFVSTMGKRYLIELYGDYWHKGESEQDRIDCFLPYGYRTLIIWEHELKHSFSLANKIRLFSDEGIQW